MADSRIKILVADTLHSAGLKLFDPAVYNLHIEGNLKGPSLLERIQEFQPQALVVRSTKVKVEHMDASHGLRLIIRAGSGTNNIDKEAATARGIAVSNCPGKNSIAVAELVFGHIINLDRRIADNVSYIRQGRWNKKQFGKTARGLYGRTLAIIGAAGQIGHLVAERALAFGMNVRGFDPYLTAEEAQNMGIERYESVEECCRGANVCTVHVPLLKSTKHLINARVMSVLSDGAYVINTSRGGLINEDDMIQMIESKGLKFGIDVYENEPAASDKEFTDQRISSNPSVYGTHHIGASTEQASAAVCEEVYNVATQFFQQRQYRNCVNQKGLTSKL